MSEELPPDPFPADVPEELKGLDTLWQDRAVEMQKAMLDLKQLLTLDSYQEMANGLSSLDELRARSVLEMALLNIRRAQLGDAAFREWAEKEGFPE
jgi:hypothetical protein